MSVPQLQALDFVLTSMAKGTLLIWASWRSWDRSEAGLSRWEDQSMLIRMRLKDPNEKQIWGWKEEFGVIEEGALDKKYRKTLCSDQYPEWISFEETLTLASRNLFLYFNFQNCKGMNLWNLFSFLFWDSISLYSLMWSWFGIHYVDQADSGFQRSACLCL